MPQPAGAVRRPAPPVRAGLSAASVPKILLTLGAACLLVAALVFLAVTWSVLGVAGRTLTLVGFTAVAGSSAAWAARKGLRAAAESLSLVALGLLALDAVGANRSGWFGDLSTAGFLVVLGVLLAATAAAAALAVRRTPAGALTGAEVVVAVGTGLACAGIAGLDRLATSPALVLAVLVATGVTAGAHALRLGVATAGAGLVTLGAWVALAAVAVGRAGQHPTAPALWVDLEVWPLLVAAALAAGPAFLRRLPTPARVACPAVGYTLLVLAVLLPAFDETPTRLTAAVLVALVATGVLSWLAPRPWGLTGALTQGVAGAGIGIAAVAMCVSAVDRLGAAAGAHWSGAVGDRLPRWAPADLPAAWMLPLCVLVLAGTVLALGQASPAASRAVRRLVDVRLGAAVGVLVAVATAALYPVPVWLPVALLGAAGLGASVAWLRGQDPVLLGLAPAALLAGLAVSLHAEWLTAALLVATLAAAGLVHLRAHVVDVAAVAGLLLSTTLAGLVWTGGALLDAGWAPVALVGLLVLGATALAAPAAPDAWWSSPAVPARGGLEAGAGAAAVPLGVAGVLLAPTADAATWAAVYLTVAGVGVVAMSLLRGDRRELGWLGGALLAAASWVRLWDVGVHAPEAYTLPSATALLVVGLVHLKRAPRAGTLPALSPGLALALVPSLLWALDEPLTPRGLLLGLACFGLVVGGARARWTAPVLWGASVGLLLVLRFAAPYVGDAVPRWVLIGAAGAVLVAMGVTWERRLADARHLVRYVRALR